MGFVSKWLAYELQAYSVAFDNSVNMLVKSD